MPPEGAGQPAGSRAGGERAWERLAERCLVGGLVLLAFGLRAFRLGTQSLWGDEVISVYRATWSLAEITAEVPREGTLPPLYYYLLHFWQPIAGQSETAVRYPSLFFGVLAVPLLYLLVRRTLGRRVAALAAGLATLSPFWIYYSQETRTYALVTALALLALYLLVRAALDPAWTASPWPWLGYAFAAALAMASYYFAGFVLAAAVLWFLADRRRWPGPAGRCLLAQGATLLLLSPLLIYVAPSLLFTAGSVARASIPLPRILEHLAVTFSFGASAPADQVWPLVVLACCLASIGLLSVPRRSALLWGLALAIPVLAIYAVSFKPQIGWARYFITASPAWYALLAAGLVAVAQGPARLIITVAGRRGAGRWSAGRRAIWPRALGLTLAGLACLGIATGVAGSLRNYYFDPAYWRYDLRSAVREVESTAATGVTVVVNGPRRFPSFFYYSRGTLPTVELPAGSSASDTASALARLAADHRGLWLVKYRPPDYDPDGLVERWLGLNAYKASLRWVENTTFSYYLAEGPASSAVAAFPIGRSFGEDAELAAYRASTVQVGGVDYLLVALTWRALRTPPDDLRVFAHLLDREGTRLAQSDHRPVDELRPTWTWTAGESLEDRFALRLPEDYRERGLSLAVGLFRPDGRRVPPNGVASPDGSLALPLPGLAPVGVGVEHARYFGEGVALVGYGLSSDRVRPGESLRLALTWRRRGPIERDYTVFTHLLDEGERVVAQRDSPPQGGRRPTTSWLLDEVLADEYEIELPADTPPGRYRLEVGLYEPDTGRRLPVREAAESPAAPEDRVLLPTAVEVVGQ